MKKVRKIFIVFLLLFFMLQIAVHINGDDSPNGDLAKKYYIENGLEETGSKNLVTAIYLDYRLFDTFFEASILLVTVTAIAFITIKDKDLL